MKRNATHLHFVPQPVPKKEAAASASPLTLQNRRYAEMQKKVAEMHYELEACKGNMTKLAESKTLALQAADADCARLRNERRQYRVENEKLTKQLSSANSQQNKEQTRRIQQLEEQNARLKRENDAAEAKLQSENQARVQLITKLSLATDENRSNAQKLQQLSGKQSEDAQHARDENKELQKRVEFLTHENVFLKNEQSKGGDNRADSAQLKSMEQSLKEARQQCARLDEEKRGMAAEMKAVAGKADKLAVLLEKSEWMNKVVQDQLEFCKRNAEMWQEQSKVLSEHLKNGGMGPAQLQPLQPQYSLQYAPPPSMSLYNYGGTPGPSQASFSSRGHGGRDSYETGYDSMSTSLRHSTPSNFSAPSIEPDIIVLELEDAKQEDIELEDVKLLDLDWAV